MAKQHFLDLAQEFQAFTECLPQNTPLRARLFGETCFLAGAAAAISFAEREGPKGSRGFFGQTHKSAERRIEFISELQSRLEQEAAAYAGADEEGMK